MPLADEPLEAALEESATNGSELIHGGVAPSPEAVSPPSPEE